MCPNPTDTEDQVTPEDEAYWASQFKEMFSKSDGSAVPESEVYCGLLVSQASVQSGSEFELGLRVGMVRATDTVDATTQLERLAALELDHVPDEHRAPVSAVVAVGRCGPMSEAGALLGWARVALRSEDDARAFVSGATVPVRLVMPNRGA